MINLLSSTNLTSLFTKGGHCEIAKASHVIPFDALKELSNREEVINI